MSICGRLTLGCMMQASVTLVRELHESLREIARVYESLRKNILIVNVNLWTVDFREAGGVTGTVDECVPEEKAELVILVTLCGVLK